MLAVIRESPSSYETGDIIALVEDGHVFSSGDLPNGQRVAVNVGTLTASEKVLLLEEDEVFQNVSAISQIPAFRHSLFNRNNLKMRRRRKFQLDVTNKPEKKRDPV